MQRRQLLTLGCAAAPLAAAQPAPASGLRLYNVRDYGAAGDGIAKDTPAIQRAIEACFNAYGGVVYVPPGVYLCGCIVLKSNVTLYLEAGATILGSKDVADYAPQPGPPLLGDANQKHLIYAREAVNVGVAGPGTIDGQGQVFWRWSKRRVPPPEDSWRDVETYDFAPLDRASPLLEFAACRNVRLEDVTIRNASGWTVRPVACDTVYIRGIVIRNPVYGPNTDGIDPTCCRNLFISDCDIATGDDAICLKSERLYGQLGPTKNVVITNCVLTCCCNGLKFGTATQGAFENVTFTNSVIYNEPVDLRARVISGIALEMVDGGRLEGVTISNIRMQNVRTPIFIRRGNRGARMAVPVPGTLRGVTIDNVHATGAILTSSITGLPGYDVEDVNLSNIRIDSDEGGREEWARLDVPELPRAYPEARMFGRLPAYGFYCRHVDGLRMRNVRVEAKTPDPRPMLVCDDVKNLEIEAAGGSAPGPSQPFLRFVNVRRALVRGCLAPDGTGTFLRVEGAETAAVGLTGNDLRSSARPVEAAPGVPASAVAAGANL